MPALRHQQAEVQGGAGYPVFRFGRTPRPHGAIRAGELDSDVGRGHALAVHGVAERARADADVRHVAQPVRGLAGDAEGVGDVLGVRPGLHDPGGQRRRGAHGRAEPRQPGSWVEIFERVQQLGAGRAEPVEQLSAAAVAEPDGDRVRVDAAAGFGVGEFGLELLGVDCRLDGDLVEVGEVADLVGDVPARRGCGRVPSGLVQPGHQRAGDRRLGGEVGGQRGHVGGHVTVLPFRVPRGPGRC